PLLHDFLIHSAKRAPEQIALVCEGRRVTYKELDDQSTALAHALQRRNVTRGDRVVAFLDNTVAAVVAFWGPLKANAVISMVSPLTKAAKLAYLLNDCRATVLICSQQSFSVVAHLVPQCPHLKSVLIVGADDSQRMGDVTAEPWERVLGAESAKSPPERRCID